MKRQAGFTMVELMAVIAIVGILTATSVRLYGTYRQRATGSEASIMLKQILDAQIIYFLEKEDFYPNGAGSSFIIPWAADASAQTLTDIQGIKDTLNLAIPVGHNLEYAFGNYGPLGFRCVIKASFPMFPDGERELLGTLSPDGAMEILRQG